MKNLLLILAIISLAFAPCAAAQAAAGGEVLVEGNPPLTRRDADEVVKYYERGLGLQFDDAQREELLERLADSWRAGQKANGRSLLNFLRAVEKINSWDEAKRGRLQKELTETVLADLSNSAATPFKQFVLEAYEAARAGRAAAAGKAEEAEAEAAAAPAEETAAAVSSAGADAGGDGGVGGDNFRPAGGTLKLSELVGRWAKDPYSVSTGGYTITTDDKGGYKNNTVYEVRPGGDFDFTAATTLYMSRCKTELYTTRKGRVSVSGQHANISFTSGTLQSKDNCSKRANYTKALGAERAELPYRLERDGAQLRLCTVGGSEPNCLYKVGR